MDHRTIDGEAALAREMNARLVERVRAMKPEHRRVGEHVDWRRRSVLEGKVPPAGVLVPLLAHAVYNDTPTDLITDVVDDLRCVVVRQREPELLAGAPSADWIDANCRETDVQGAADSAQARALATRSLGDLIAMRMQALRHIAALWRLVCAVDRKIGDDAAATRIANARLRQMLSPAS